MPTLPTPTAPGFVDRRQFVRHGLIAASALTAGANQVRAADPAPAPSTSYVRHAGIKALTFDVFGTVVDFRSSIIREGQLLTKTRGIQVDWPRFTDAWRAGYRPALDRIRSGQDPWADIDTIHRRVLDELLRRFEITGLTEAEIADFNRVWHRLMPWPDTLAGLHRLRSRYVLATLSNGSVALLVNMAKNAGLPWDCVLSAEMSGHYKTDPEVYLTAARLLGLAPAQIMMVAAHRNDILAAGKLGFRTAFVTRPLEFGPEGKPDIVTASEVDLIARDFLDLAERLGA